MSICDKIRTVGDTLETNLNARGVSCTFGTGTSEKTILDMVNLITSSNLKGSSDAVISISASRPYLLSGEKTDLIVTLKNGLGAPLANKSVTVSDGTSSYSGITNSLGLFTLYDVTVSADTTFTATYGTVSDSCLVEYCFFADYCVTNNNKSSQYYQQNGTYSIGNDGLTITQDNQRLNFREYNGGISVGDNGFKIIFELLEENFSSDPRIYFYNDYSGSALTNGTFYLQSSNPTVIEFTVTPTGITRKIGTGNVTNLTVSGNIGSTVYTSLGSSSANTGTIKYRNFKIKAL